jgi:ribosome-associated heat shock protein Hsp15
MSGDRVRIDKWLWAARFYKTRSLAARAVDGGKIQVNGDRARRSKTIQAGDQVRIRLGPYQYDLRVLVPSEHRGPASEAATLYQESAASRAARERLALQMRLARTPVFEGKGRPTKRDRRRLERFRDEAGGG